VSGTGEIRVRGARVHNLKNVHVGLPRDRLVVVCGPSGSGKSSLAFDTLYAEGQRRYVESLSAYARQFMEQSPKPDVDGIDGLSPAIAIEQKSVSHNPRSTVGTVTECHDYLRLLYARAGLPHCPGCGQPVRGQTVQEMVDRALDFPKDTRLSVLAPVVRGRKGEHQALLQELRKSGFTRARVDGEPRELEQDIRLEKNRAHEIAVVVDRVIVKEPERLRVRLADSVEKALELAGGLVLLVPQGGPELLLSEDLACPGCGLSLPELHPRLFSFNNPHGACPACDGLGQLRFIDPARVAPDPGLSLREGALVGWGRAGGDGYYWQMLESLARHYRIPLDKPFGKLSERQRRLVLHGSGDEALTFRLQSERMSHEVRRPFEVAVPNLERRYRETQSEAIRAELEELMTFKTCQACQGRRLRPEALAVRVGGASIAELSSLSAAEALARVAELAIEPRHQAVAERILREVRSRLRFLVDVGLGYLSLDRATASLSGGESQRIRLATQIGANLVGVLYVLDEPTIGLHPRDCERLLDTLRELRDRGNTVVVVEHDPTTLRAADHIVELGPGAGRQGGEVVAEGTPAELMRSPRSLTGAYLAGRRPIPVPVRRRRPSGHLRLRGARVHNLKNLDVDLPLGVLTCVTGVSGSGKSSLVLDTLHRALARRLQGASAEPGPHEALLGLERLDKVIHVDQSPIGRTPRSNPATYTGLFAPLRELFAALPESRARGYGPGRFSFNVKGGRCEACQGGGQIRVEMHFLPDMFVTCEACGGRRFNRETLEIRFRGRDVHQALGLTVSEALEFFAHQPALTRKLATLAEVGLGYVELGQSAVTLSGGEAQRVKLSRELCRRSTGRSLYILDEPTTGLHMEDIRLLLGVLDRLVEAGNSVVVIEHNLDVVKQADWILDLGPEGGQGGGRLVAQGTPEQLALVADSHTGRALRPTLGLCEE
jgi:excinuclease ABC subunit A